MKMKKLLSIFLTMFVVSASFLSINSASAKTEDIYNQATQMPIEKSDIQTAINLDTVELKEDLLKKKEFIISNKDEFARFMTTSKYWESNYKITLTCDIDMEDAVFKPIKEFSGQFDGRGHTVSNFSVQDSVGLDKNFKIAFIETLNNLAKIKDVTFNEYAISVQSSTSSGKLGYYEAAGLVLNNHGNISGVKLVSSSAIDINHDNLKLDSKEAYKFCKTAGFVLNNYQDGIIENCYIYMYFKNSNFNSGFVYKNSGKITGSNANLSINSVGIAGGFVVENEGNIENCSFHGEVKSCEYVGGFCGFNMSEILNCNFSGSVILNRNIFNLVYDSKNFDKIGRVGGFCGYNSGNIGSCKSKCSVESNAKSIYNICGGFVGENNGGTISDCTSNGNVTGQEHVGGFCGDNNGNIKDSVSMGSAVGSEYVGGFIGINKSEIIGCYAYGKATAKTKIFTARAGGFVGENRKGTVINCTSTKGADSHSSLGQAKAGGFVGVNKAKITNSKASGCVCLGTGTCHKDNSCGGFVGTNGKTGIIKDITITNIKINNKNYNCGFLGGFVGANIGKIENGNTTVSVTNGKYTGGFCGNNSGEISVSQSEGNVTTNATTVETKCGGFVGNNDKTGKIISCTSKGSVIGQEYLGGFCGDNSGDIIKSKSEGNVNSKTIYHVDICGGFVGGNNGNIQDSISMGNAIGGKYVGGFVGLNKSDIIDCNAHGKATAKTKIFTACAGGFVGENEKGTIISCKATGGSDSISKNGQAKVGGFVGVNKAVIMISKASGYIYISAGTCYKDDGCGGFVGKNDQNGSIDGCYAEVIMQTKNKEMVGGFVGEAKNKSTIKNCNCKTKIISKSGTKNNTKFCQNRDKKAVIKNCSVS